MKIVYPKTLVPSFSNEQRSQAIQKYKDIIQDSKVGFASMLEGKGQLDQCKDLYNRFQEKRHFIQIGIGGSSLGPQMLISALQSNDRKFTFIDNVDPEKLHRQLSQLDPSQCLFYVVSKSGGTAETIAALSIICNWLNDKGISEVDFPNYLVACTGTKGDLLDFSRDFKLPTLEVPENVGGRFSVLTPVGLFPALFAGIDITELFHGAGEYSKYLQREENSELPEMALTIHKLYSENIRQTVLMPYSSRLRDFSFWFVQLWAESLGKKKNLAGEIVHIGLTPIPSSGATDQHSQMQLFMEGPNEKLLLMLEVEEFEQDFSLQTKFPYSAFKKLSPFTLGQLMKAEFNGTLKALEEAERKFVRLSIPKLDERELGKIIIFFEALTALTGNLLGVDPFDQPGVEAGKKYAFEWLAK